MGGGAGGAKPPNPKIIPPPPPPPPPHRGRVRLPVLGFLPCLMDVVCGKGIRPDSALATVCHCDGRLTWVQLLSEGGCLVHLVVPAFEGPNPITKAHAWPCRVLFTTTARTGHSWPWLSVIHTFLSTDPSPSQKPRLALYWHRQLQIQMPSLGKLPLVI